MHPCLGVNRLRCCIVDLVELSNRLRVLGSKLLRSLLVLASTRVRDCVTNLAKCADKVPKMLIGFLYTWKQIILVTGIVISRMKVGFEQLAQMVPRLDRALGQVQQPHSGRPLKDSR